MNINIADFEKKIIKGLQISYNDAYFFNGRIVADIKPEYLITVNIAKELSSFNSVIEDNIDYPISIKLEERARTFLNACRVYVEGKTIFQASYWKNIKSDIKPKSKQRVDIAVYENTKAIFDRKPFTVIEVKKFPDKERKLLKDINRNLTFLGLHKGEISESRLFQTYIVFLHNDKETVEKDKTHRYIDKLNADYKAFLDNLNLPDKFSYEIQVLTISDNLFSEIQKHWPKEVLEDFADDLFHYIGVLIKFERK